MNIYTPNEAYDPKGRTECESEDVVRMSMLISTRISHVGNYLGLTVPLH